jgi:hypothetical protein
MCHALIHFKIASPLPTPGPDAKIYSRTTHTDSLAQEMRLCVRETVHISNVCAQATMETTGKWQANNKLCIRRSCFYADYRSLFYKYFILIAMHRARSDKKTHAVNKYSLYRTHIKLL